MARLRDRVYGVLLAVLSLTCCAEEHGLRLQKTTLMFTAIMTGIQPRAESRHATSSACVGCSKY